MRPLRQPNVQGGWQHLRLCYQFGEVKLHVFEHVLLEVG